MSKKRKAAAAAAAAQALQKAKEAAEARDVETKRKKSGFGRLVRLALLGGIVTLAASEPARSKVLDVLFGAEEEFQYTPPATETAAPAAAPAPAA